MKEEHPVIMGKVRINRKCQLYIFAGYSYYL